jgi:hypothetical protein
VGGGEAAAAGDASPLDESDGQRVLPQHRLEQVAQAQRIAQVLLGSGVAQRGQMIEIGPGREVPARPREDHGAQTLLA